MMGNSLIKQLLVVIKLLNIPLRKIF